MYCSLKFGSFTIFFIDAKLNKDKPRASVLSPFSSTISFNQE
ncbi:hypothetical protein EVA_17048 [gut metagenome]|uniref:Uncharacterized protein n=1 Tax=gut metagenome TaxID=749906 RepID=J9C4V0_9ZZZZ